MVQLISSSFARIRALAAGLAIMLLWRLQESFQKVGDYYNAERALLITLFLRPQSKEIARRLADFYDLTGQSERAIRLMESLLSEYPSDPDIHRALAELYADFDTEIATRHLELYQQLPHEPSVLLTLGGLIQRLSGNIDQSCKLFRECLEIKNSAKVLTLLANNLIDEGGAHDEAIALLLRAIEAEPRNPKAYHMLAECKYYQSTDHPHVQFMTALVSNGDLPTDVRASFYSVLGKINDRLGLWDKAFAHFDAMNRLERTRFRFDTAKYIEGLGSRITVFNQAFLSDLRNTPSSFGESLIFVVGMPRSGTSLLEQILASHPKVYGGGERRDIPRIISEASKHAGLPHPLCWPSVEADLRASLAQEHLARVSRLMGDRSVFVDKLCGNCFELGLITSLFPRAKIIHIKRDPLDTCLSCYFGDFYQVPYTNDLAQLGIVYRHYQRMMEHWRAVLPGRFYEVEYESLVTDSRNQIGALLDYCELPWHDDCLTPHQTKRPVFTLSQFQVKKPISSASVGRWKNYGKYMGPLISELPDLSRSECNLVLWEPS